MKHEETPILIPTLIAHLEAQPRFSRFIALGLASALALSGCGAIGDTMDNATGELAVLQMDNQGAYDYSLWPACAEPATDTPQPMVERMAEQCEAEGSNEAELVVIDLTDSQEKAKLFMGGIQDEMYSVTKGYFTLKPKLIDHVRTDTKEHILESLSKTISSEPCVDTDDTTTTPSSVLLEENPELKQVPYVVVLSEYPSCNTTVAGLATGPNTVDIFNYDEMGLETAKAVGSHELGHLLFGLSHVGTLAPKHANDPSRYTLTKDDLTFGEVNLKYIAELAKYHRYIPQQSADANIMGMADAQVLGGTLMPHQEDQLHWWDKYVGKEYTPKVTLVGNEVFEFLPEDGENVAGMAMLEKPIIIPDDDGDEDFVADAVLWQPIAGIDPNMGNIVESVFISLISIKGSKTALVGYLTEELNGERSWVLNLGPNKTLHLNSVYGPLQASVKE